MDEWIKIIGLALKASILIQVFATGLGASWHDATYLFREPRLLWNSILARNIAVPIIAILLIQAFSLHPVVMIALAVLSVTPVPPLVPKGQIKEGGRSEYVLGLLVSQALLAIVLVPLTIQVMNWIFAREAHFGPAQVAVLVFQTILVPLAAGMIVARVAPAVKSIAPHLLTAGTVLLLAGAIPLLPLAWNALGTLFGNGTLLSMAIFVVLATAVGHLLGGPSPADRTTLAEATSARHPGIAIAIAMANFPDRIALVAGAIVIYLLVRIILSIPYMRWRRLASGLTPNPTYRQV